MAATPHTHKWNKPEEGEEANKARNLYSTGSQPIVHAPLLVHTAIEKSLQVQSIISKI